MFYIELVSSCLFPLLVVSTFYFHELPLINRPLAMASNKTLKNAIAIKLTMPSNLGCVISKKTTSKLFLLIFFLYFHLPFSLQKNLKLSLLNTSGPDDEGK